MDIREVIREIETALEADPGPDADALRAVLGTLDNVAFIPELKKFVQSWNNQDDVAEVLEILSKLMRRCSQTSAKRKNDVVNLQIGGSTGGAAVVASIIAIASTTIPGFFVIPLFGGAWMSWICLSHTRPLTEEAQIYADMAERLKVILERADER